MTCAKNDLYMAVCDAVNARVKEDIKTVGLRWQAAYDLPAYTEWVKAQLLRFGLTAASRDCGGRFKVAEYAGWVAREIMHKADPGHPEFATPAIITGDDEIDYWRAVTIASVLKRQAGRDS